MDVEMSIPETLNRNSLRARRAFLTSHTRGRRGSENGGSATSRTYSPDRVMDWKVDPPMLWYDKEQQRARELASMTALTLPLSESASDTMPSTSTPAVSTTKQQLQEQQHMRVHSDRKQSTSRRSKNSSISISSRRRKNSDDNDIAAASATADNGMTAVSHEHVHVASHDAAAHDDGRDHHPRAQQHEVAGNATSASQLPQHHGHQHYNNDDGSNNGAVHYVDAHGDDEASARATEHHLAAAQAEGLAPVYHTEVHKTADGANHVHAQHAQQDDGSGDAAHTAARDVHDAVGRSSSAEHDHRRDDDNALHAAQDERHHPADESAPQSNREKLHMMVQHSDDPMAPHRAALREPDPELVPRKAATDTRARVMAANIPHAPHESTHSAHVVAPQKRHRVPYVVRFHGSEWAHVLPRREAEIKQGLVLDVTHALRVEPGDVDEVSLEMRDVMVAKFAVYQPSDDAEFLRAAKKTLRESSFINVCKLYPDAATRSDDDDDDDATTPAAAAAAKAAATTTPTAAAAAAAPAAHAQVAASA